ncbi:hypothetical protein BVRB_2g033740 [Beta vulgaris subsp. vulgaris]|nr:hypothetical protein BVRB_2g033740 [Beta vulgaris subsp. vulgaris]
MFVDVRRSAVVHRWTTVVGLLLFVAGGVAPVRVGFVVVDFSLPSVLRPPLLVSLLWLFCCG